LIDPARVDSRGRTNLQRMRARLAPVDANGKPIALHHMLQTNAGPLAEVTSDFHQTNSRVIHINPNSIPSGIDRRAFNAYKRQYWRARAADFAPQPGERGTRQTDRSPSSGDDSPGDEE
jgi:hypothetical protein